MMNWKGYLMKKALFSVLFSVCVLMGSGTDTRACGMPGSRIAFIFDEPPPNARPGSIRHLKIGRPLLFVNKRVGSHWEIGQPIQTVRTVKYYYTTDLHSNRTVVVAQPVSSCPTKPIFWGQIGYASIYENDIRPYRHKKFWFFWEEEYDLYTLNPQVTDEQPMAGARQ